MPRLPVVRDYMDVEVATVAPDMEILEAIDFLIAHHVTGAPVVDADNHVVGILTELDCLKLLSVGNDGDVAQGKVADFMTKNPITLGPNTNIYYAAGVFLSHSFRRLPIVEGGRLVGAITRFDLVRAVSVNHKLVQQAG